MPSPFSEGMPGSGGGVAVSGKAYLRTNARSEKQPPAGKCRPVRENAWAQGIYKIGAPGTTPADRLGLSPVRGWPGGNRHASAEFHLCDQVRPALKQ